jgi:hypothetical protein
MFGWGFAPGNLESDAVDECAGLNRLRNNKVVAVELAGWVDIDIDVRSHGM